MVVLRYTNTDYLSTTQRNRVQFGMSAWAAVGVPALLMDHTDRMAESLVSPRAGALWSPLGRVKARPGYAYDTAH